MFPQPEVLQHVFDVIKEKQLMLVQDGSCFKYELMYLLLAV